MVTSRPKATLAKDAAMGNRFAIVVSRYHEEVTQELLAGALDTLKNHGAKAEGISIYWVPGAFEIPMAARAVCAHEGVDAVICLGVILKGETSHHEHIAREVARGIAQIHASTGIPAIFGVLTPDTLEQAKARAGGNHGHKGIEAAEAAIAMVKVLDEIKRGLGKQIKSVGF
jgi:6,7-dimethyl-8-ribityllumazine synthase